MPFTAFEPSRDGFAFANDWTLSPDERTQLREQLGRALERAARVVSPAFPGAFFLARLSPWLAGAVASSVPDGYGLCGGMAFAALDFQRAGRSVFELYQARPAVGSPLYVYLWRRLLESLSLNGHTFLAWIGMLHAVPARWPFRGGAPWLLARTTEQWRLLQEHLDRGEPMPLGLIGETRDPFKDHQVLAYGYDAPDASRPVIHVYDMNCPGGGRSIELDLSGRTLVARESCAGARGALRGLFVENYVPASPP